MFYPSNLHTHTPFCDGKDTMADMAAAAAATGLCSLGFSPHSPLPYENDWAMKPESYPAFFAEAERLKRLYAGKMEILTGLEWDLDTPELPEGLDYVIGAVHSLVKKGRRFSVDYTKDLLLQAVGQLYDNEILELCRDYYRAVRVSSLRPGVTITAHLDLVTKYNKDGEILNENDPEYLALAKECIDGILSERPDMLFEINTGVMARAGKKVPYPAPELLRYLCENGAGLILSCDCHRKELLCKGYEVVPALLADCRAPKLYILRNGCFQIINVS